MKVWIALAVTLCVFAQSGAAAFMVAGMAAEAAATTETGEPGLPCHDDAGENPAPAAGCCDGDCFCAALCAGQAGAVTELAVAAAPAPTFELRAGTSSAHAPYSLTPLRPPILLQS